MRKLSAIIFSIGIFVSCFFAQSVRDSEFRAVDSKKANSPISVAESEKLDSVLRNAIENVVKNLEKEKIKPEEIAASIIDLSDPNNLQTSNFNGDIKIYPASVVKMFYLVAVHKWLEDGKLKSTPELERGLRDMIIDSSNDATHYILDVLTETSSGGEMPEKEFIEWSYKRNAVNRYFSSLGYENINVNQKTYCEDAYGREQQFRSYRGLNRNMLTTKATAMLLAQIALGKAVSKERSSKMLDLMKRDPFALSSDAEDQAHGFTGISLIELGLKDAKLYSKAGWTSTTRHDAAYIETPAGMKLVIVIFTQNHAKQRSIISGIASAVISDLDRKN